MLAMATGLPTRENQRLSSGHAEQYRRFVLFGFDSQEKSEEKGSALYPAPL
jgi:hypothetical protein